MARRQEAAVIALSPFSIDPHIGLELGLHEQIDLLLGYDVRNFTTGISGQYLNWKLNYGFELDTELENSHRISIGYIL